MQSYRYTASYFIEDEDGIGERRFVRFESVISDACRMVKDCEAYYIYNIEDSETVGCKGFDSDVVGDAEIGLITDYTEAREDEKPSDILIDFHFGIFE